MEVNRMRDQINRKYDAHAWVDRAQYDLVILQASALKGSQAMEKMSDSLLAEDMEFVLDNRDSEDDSEETNNSST